MIDVSVYVHFPFCLSKCPYCDFASEGLARERIPDASYTDAVLREIEVRSALLDGATIVTVFFGGGTPSLWDPRSVARVLAALPGRPTEVTIECNPSSLDLATVVGFLEAGIDRFSIGIQSLRDRELAFLGRLHDARGALRALDEARRAGVRRIGVDLLAGLPGQDPALLAEDVERVVEAGATHVSAYGLTIEPGTPFGRLARGGRLDVATDDEHAACLEAVERTLLGAGFLHYEVSNYAMPGQEARHNLHTWRGGDSLGVGAAAVTTLSVGPDRASPTRWRNVDDGFGYVAGVARLAHGSVPMEGDGVVVDLEVLETETLVREAWMLGLRLAEGLSIPATIRRLGADPREGRGEVLEALVRAGDVVSTEEVVRVPSDRWIVLDRIVREIF